MGLDMYLSAKKVVEEDLVIWRKANAIHRFFIENCCGGKDDCSKHKVTKYDLEFLIKSIDMVLKDHALAPLLLPTMEGFYFGGTEYDELYFEELESTNLQIKKVYESLDRGELKELYYSSSW